MSGRWRVSLQKSDEGDNSNVPAHENILYGLTGIIVDAYDCLINDSYVYGNVKMPFVFTILEPKLPSLETAVPTPPVGASLVARPISTLSTAVCGLILPASLSTAQKNYDPVGNRFWNKLGFNNTQLFKTFVGSETDAITGRYLPKGTTDNLADISDALIGSNEPAENTPLFTTVAAFGKSTTASQAGYDFSSWGAMNFNNHATGYGLPNTAGQPNQFEGNSPDDLDNGVVNFSEYESTYNPDRERNTSYIFTSIGEPIVAEGLPTKTEFPYFLCMSDLIDTNFNISKNHGSGLNCMGLISKANAEQDFYFQYQAPQSFYASKDTTITSITTELRTPNLGIPPALSPYSSVIYQITRYAPRPIKTSMPVWLEQNMAFSQIKDILQQISTSLNTQPLISSDNVNTYVDAPIDVGASLNNIIPDMEADQVEVYTEWIKDNRSLVRMGTLDTRDGGIMNLQDIRPDLSLSKLLGEVVNLSNNDGDNFSNDNFLNDTISEATVTNEPIPIKKDEVSAGT